MRIPNSSTRFDLLKSETIVPWRTPIENIEIRPDIFPSKWHYKNLSSEDVEWITGGINRASQLTTKSRLNSSYWKKISLDKLIESYSDEWNYGDQMIICVWDAHQKESEPPIGFISFDIAWHETSTKKISDLFLTINLIWVRPDKRGLGGISARHITSHLILYFESCKLYHPFVALKGLTVFYYADFDSLGGEKISYIIQENLENMKYNNTWKIRELDFDVGF